MKDEYWETRYPFIKWREPQLVTGAGGEKGLACRFCIATKGLRGSEIASLAQTREEFNKHMEEHHQKR